MPDLTRAHAALMARAEARHGELVDAYLETGSVTDAAARAGYSRHHASTLLNSAAFLAAVQAAQREAGITPLALARVLADALVAERVHLAPDGKGGVREIAAIDHRTRLNAYALVTRPHEKRAEAHEQAQARAERPDMAALEALTDEELLDALARRGRRQQPPIEATLVD
jgi:phage terminase small subunit